MKNSNIEISIIMNCHNGEKFLYESLQSIIDQTFENWELIFFDNFSKDKSLEILKSFSDRRIKFFSSKKFLNLYHARNEAIKKASGKYICFLDTDDLWVNDKLEKQIKFMEQNKNYVMVYSNYYTIKKEKKFIQNNFSLPEGKITKDLLKKYSIGILTTCVRREVFEKFLFDKNRNIIGDFDFFLKLSLDNSIGCIQEPLAYYRVHDNNLSKKKIEIYINELSDWIELNSKNFNKYELSLFHIRFLIFKLKIKNFLKKMGV